MKKHIVISFVLGSKNRRKLLTATIESIRCAAKAFTHEIIVVDGGSRDGSCEWLARQRDVLTIIQPNYDVLQAGQPRRAHSWGSFMNLGFRAARGEWIVMVSDDLLLCDNSIDIALQRLKAMEEDGIPIGGGALYWRDYPRQREYHVKVLPGNVVHINHGFYKRAALEAVGYVDESAFEFYGADGDLSMRLNEAGWHVVALEGCFAEHLNHTVRLRRILRRVQDYRIEADMAEFDRRYRHRGGSHSILIARGNPDRSKAACLWRLHPIACLQGWLMRQLLSRRQRGSLK